MSNTIFSYYIIADDDLLQAIQEEIRSGVLLKESLNNKQKCIIIGCENNPSRELIAALRNGHASDNIFLCLHARFFGDLENSLKNLDEIKRSQPIFPSFILIYSRQFDSCPIQLPKEFMFLERGGDLTNTIKKSIEKRNSIDEIPLILDKYFGDIKS